MTKQSHADDRPRRWRSASHRTGSGPDRGDGATRLRSAVAQAVWMGWTDELRRPLRQPPRHRAHRPEKPAEGHLVLEMSADGAVDRCRSKFIDRADRRPPEAPIFALSSPPPLAPILRGLFQGACPAHPRRGMVWSHRTGVRRHARRSAVGQITKAGYARRAVGDASSRPKVGDVTALDRLDRVRAAIRRDRGVRAGRSRTPIVRPSARRRRRAWRFITRPGRRLREDLPLAAAAYRWPMVAHLRAGQRRAWRSVAWSRRHSRHPGVELGDDEIHRSHILLAGGRLTRLRHSARGDRDVDLLQPSREGAAPTRWKPRAPRPRHVLHQMLAGENHYAQNHMVSITQRKPGLTRQHHQPARVLDHRRHDRPQRQAGPPRRHRHDPLSRAG